MASKLKKGGTVDETTDIVYEVQWPITEATLDMVRDAAERVLAQIQEQYGSNEIHIFRIFVGDSKLRGAVIRVDGEYVHLLHSIHSGLRLKEISILLARSGTA